MRLRKRYSRPAALLNMMVQSLDKLDGTRRRNHHIPNDIGTFKSCRNDLSSQEKDLGASNRRDNTLSKPSCRHCSFAFEACTVTTV
ncbi:hypothetical protein LENED_007168 [Lentinula edodes]|uniref:Uncharacterized protein n=1 Tax=Lentinula edodes TaxID=5353 RepID=A0A1Q3EDM9_LENED|nr:hypothetical protein LENED_007168 [Lentinula edodes]